MTSREEGRRQLSQLATRAEGSGAVAQWHSPPHVCDRECIPGTRIKREKVYTVA